MKPLNAFSQFEYPEVNLDFFVEKKRQTKQNARLFFCEYSRKENCVYQAALKQRVCDPKTVFGNGFKSG